MTASLLGLTGLRSRARTPVDTAGLAHPAGPPSTWASVGELTSPLAPASLVGWSLGGVIAREVARRHPEAVRRVITYGTPVAGGAAYTSVARASGRGSRVDAGAERVTRTLDARSPIAVPLTVVFSRRDGVVAWQACIDRATPGVEHVEVSSTHIGMGVDPDVWAVVAERLAA